MLWLEKLVELEEENAQLKEVIEKGSAENAELRKKLRIKELEDTSADDLKVLAYRARYSIWRT